MIAGNNIQLKQRLEKIKAAIHEDLDKGLNLAALALQAAAQQKCPVDTGALRASAYTRKEGTVDKIEYKIGFSQYYSVYVHEMVNANFKVGQAKFLEEPFMLMKKELGDLVIATLKSGNNNIPPEPKQGDE